MLSSDDMIVVQADGNVQMPGAEHTVIALLAAFAAFLPNAPPAIPFTAA